MWEICFESKEFCMEFHQKTIKKLDRKYTARARKNSAVMLQGAFDSMKDMRIPNLPQFDFSKEQ